MSRPLKRLLLISGMLFLGAGLVVGFIVIQALGRVDPVKTASLNSVEAEDASRKMRRFEESLTSSRQGYIRLNEVELNSILESRLLPALKAGHSEPKADSPQLLRGLVGLQEEGMTWYYWVNVPWAGRDFQFVLQHAVRLCRQNEQWKFETTAMRVGRLAIPQRFWSKIEQPSGAVYNELSKPYQWLLNVPALDLTTNQFNRKPELCLYNYPAPEVLQKYKK